ncbi:MAG: PIN domain-containing protein [Bryobacteraceae bacterium]
MGSRSRRNVLRLTYLDTQIVVWLGAGKRARVSREAARAIERASHLLVSPVVELELAYLHERKRIKVEPMAILSDLASRIGLLVCDLPFQMVAHEAVSLARINDPFDRLIVAQASATASPLITADSHIIENYRRAIW